MIWVDQNQTDLIPSFLVIVQPWAGDGISLCLGPHIYETRMLMIHPRVRWRRGGAWHLAVGMRYTQLFFFALYLNTQSQVFKYQADVIWSRDEVWSFYVSTRCWHATIMQKLFMKWKTASIGVGLPAVMEQRRRDPRRPHSQRVGAAPPGGEEHGLRLDRDRFTPRLCGLVTM